MDPLTLRPFSSEDIRRTYAWVQSEELQRLFTIRGTPTWETHLAHFQRLLADPTQRAFTIYYLGRHVGNCGLKNIHGGQAELWLYIGEESKRGKGYGKLACAKLLSEATDLQLHRLYLHVLSSNHPAIRLYEALGFRAVEMDAIDENQWRQRNLEILRMERLLDGT